MKTKVHRYPGGEVTVTFDSARCIHAARCITGLPAVFDVNGKPWIQPDKAGADRVIAVVRECPSGALAVGPAPPAETDNAIEVQENGPLYLRGRLSLARLSGGAVFEDDRMALCRCGASANKPLCDNSHLETGFQAPSALGRLSADRGEGPGGPLTIAIAPNGPLLLDGPAEIRGGGSSVKVRKAALCRCGLSENKPYCDGSHASGGFRAD